MSEDRNSLDFWFPRLLKAGVSVPRTEIVRSDVEFIEVFDGKKPDGLDGFMEEIARAAERIGYPVFCRTSHAAGKHEWTDTCFVPRPDDLAQHVLNLVEWSAMADLLGLPTDVWAVREMLPTRPAFHAFRAMPVCRERRYFISDGKVLGGHPYWPPASIVNPSEVDWENRLAVLNHESDDEVAELTALTERVAAQFEGAWSVDWLYAEERGWVCIDMAEAARSFCWFDHPGAPTAEQVGQA